MPVGILPKAGSGVSRLSILGLAGDGVAEAFGEALQAEGAALLVLGEAGALHRHVVSDVGNAKELGRASCRERVRQYVKIAVVAVSLNKTKPTIRSNPDIY